MFDGFHLHSNAKSYRKNSKKRKQRISIENNGEDKGPNSSHATWCQKNSKLINRDSI